MRARRCSVSAHSTVPAARDGSCHPPVLQIGTRRHREVKRLVLGDRATATTPGLDPGPPPFRGRGGHGDTRVSQPRASADTGRSTHAPFHRPCRPQARGYPPEDRPPETEHRTPLLHCRGPSLLSGVTRKSRSQPGNVPSLGDPTTSPSHSPAWAPEPYRATPSPHHIDQTASGSTAAPRPLPVRGPQSHACGRDGAEWGQA